MNFKEIKNIVDHLTKTSKCPSCKGKYKADDINVIATTKQEGLFELKCQKCKSNSIANVVVTPTEEYFADYNNARSHQSITKDDILDVKNFLNNFDGNFKRIFTKKK